MKTLAHTLLTVCFAASSMAALADDAMKKESGMGAMTKSPSMQDCKDHMAMAEKDTMKKDDDMGKKCSAMMKKHDGMMKKDDAMMKKEGAASGAMKN